MRYVLWLVSWSVFLSTPSLMAADSARVDFSFFWRLAPSVFKIEAYNRNGGVSVGSGVLVRQGWVVTNCHVTRQAVAIQIVKQGLRWDAHAQVSDVEHDVCLLEVPEITGTVALMNGHRPHVGERVIAVGYVGGLAPQLSGGEVQALYHYDGGQVIQSTAWFNSGASGGGLFDQDGELIGIIAFRHQGGDAYHFALPVDWIYGNLDLERARAVTPLGSGLAFWQQNGDRQPYFLKAAALEAKQDWRALRELAEKWSAAEAANSDAWLSLGLANTRLGDLNRAVTAYVKAIHSDLENSEAWFNLGLAYAALGERQRLDEVRRVLLTLDEDLAAKLNQTARDR